MDCTKVFKNWFLLVLTFLFFSNDGSVYSVTSRSTPTMALSAPRFSFNADDIERLCTTALTEKFGEVKNVSMWGMHTYDSFSRISLCQLPDDGWKFCCIKGASSGITVESLHPEGMKDLSFIDHWTGRNSSHVFKARNPASAEEFVCWEFTARGIWRSIEKLPVHPLGRWHNSEFNEAGDLLFTKHIFPASLVSQYWTIHDGVWKFMFEGGNDQILVIRNDQVYRFSYGDIGLTIDWLNGEHEFEPTNAKNFPIQFIFLSFSDRQGFHVSTKNPREILALEDYSDGMYKWRFPESSVLTLKPEYDEIIENLRGEWKKEKKFYADCRLSVNYLGINEEGRINELSLYFSENLMFTASVKISGGSPEFSWSRDESQFHQPLQMHNVDVEGHPVPYFYVPPEGVPNGKTIVMVEGGPWGEYTGNYAAFVKAFTQAGWSVVIPQESLRTGYGWKHLAKGFGEMGRKNLHQLLHVFSDAVTKGLITNPEQTHLYGSSYGGFVAASFALRWDYLHAEARLPKLFNFQSIVADIAFLDIGEGDLFNTESMIKSMITGGVDIEMFRKSFMPLHLVGGSLSAPLTLVHGKADIVCPALYASEFAGALRSADNPFNIFWHDGGHESPQGPYPEFLLALMEGRPIDDMTAELKLTREA